MTHSQYRDVQCGTLGCPKHGVQSRIIASLMGSHLYSWPTVTCRGCGLEPTVISEEQPPATDIRSIAQGQ